MIRYYKYITGLDKNYLEKQDAWNDFILTEKYDPTQEYILIRNSSIWIIYQLL